MLFAGIVEGVIVISVALCIHGGEDGWQSDDSPARKMSDFKGMVAATLAFTVCHYALAWAGVT